MSEKPVPVMTGKQPMTLQKFVYMACMFVSISALAANFSPFLGAMYGFFAATPHLKVAAFCINMQNMQGGDRGLEPLQVALLDVSGILDFLEHLIYYSPSENSRGFPEGGWSRVVHRNPLSGEQICEGDGSHAQCI